MHNSMNCSTHACDMGSCSAKASTDMLSISNTYSFIRVFTELVFFVKLNYIVVTECHNFITITFRSTY